MSCWFGRVVEGAFRNDDSRQITESGHPQVAFGIHIGHFWGHFHGTRQPASPFAKRHKRGPKLTAAG